MPWDNTRRNPAYGTAEWKRARDACLKAANRRCAIRLEGCQHTASEADHIIGLANDPHHTQLRAACRNCHAKVTARQGHDARGHGGEPDFTGSWDRW